MSDAHFVGEIGQKALITHEGKVLMCRSVGETSWDFPGGRLHIDEKPDVGLLRELREELGVTKAIVGRPLHTFAFVPKSGIPRFFVVYACTLENDAMDFRLAEDEIAEVRWVERKDVETLETREEWSEVLRHYFES